MTGLRLECDELGLRPLYWTRPPGRSVISSDRIVELFDHPQVDTSYDLEVVLLEAMRLPPLDEFATRTRFSAIHRVPGGHRLTIRPDGSTTLERYWSVDELPEVDARLHLTDAADLLRERLDQAIHRSLSDGGRIAGHVSGGLDCTAVTCRAHEMLLARDRSLTAAYSWSPEEAVLPRLASDERALLDDVEHQLGMRVQRLVPDASGAWFDELCEDRYPQATHALERFVLPAARDAGVDLMLSGWGGDELASFNGRTVIRSLVRRGRWLAAWQHLDQRHRLMNGRALSPYHRVRAFVGTLLDHTPLPVDRIRQPSDARRERELDHETDRMLREASPAVADIARRHAERFARARDHHDYQLALLENGHLQRRVHGWHQTGQLFGIEYRYPLLDLDVVRAALSMPWQAFASQGWTRLAFRLAIEPWVPPSVAWNLTKDEPALFSDAVMPAFREFVDRLPDDAGYRATVELAQRVQSLREHQPLPRRQVQARPEMAPRPS